jgi:hypothetical protein
MFFKWNKIAAVGLMAFLSSAGIMAQEAKPDEATPAVAANNLVANGDFKNDKASWLCVADMHLADKEFANKLKGQIKPLVEFNVVDLPEGGKAACTRKPLELEGICGESTARVSGSWRQTVTPDKSGGSYSINFRYKGEVFGKFKTKCVLLVLWKDSTGKNILKEFPISNPTKDWQKFTAKVEVPANTDSIGLTLRIDGTGEIYFADVQVVK